MIGEVGFKGGDVLKAEGWRNSAAGTDGKFDVFDVLEIDRRICRSLDQQNVAIAEGRGFHLRDEGIGLSYVAVDPSIE